MSDTDDVLMERARVIAHLERMERIWRDAGHPDIADAFAQEARIIAHAGHVRRRQQVLRLVQR